MTLISAEEFSSIPDGSNLSALSAANPLSLLPEAYQTVLRLHDIEGKTYVVIAQTLNKSEGTVKSLAHRGRKLLRIRTIQALQQEALSSLPQTTSPFHSTAIERLPKPYRTILRLHYIDGLSYSQMTQILGKPPGTIKSLVNRGKKLLREWSSSWEDHHSG